MNLNPTRSIVALLLMSAAGMFTLIVALSNEPPVEKPAPLTAVTSAAAGDDIYTQPGQLVALDGVRLNLYCMGTGRLAYSSVRFRMGRLGAGMVKGAAADRKVDTRVQL
jgi:hypothetical protein